MPLHAAVAATLNPSDYVIAPHTCALDEFRMTDPDGTFVCDITPKYLQRFVTHMNEREALTGDLSPIVIGHTHDGLPETQQPPLIGFARNWHLGTLGTTGRQAAFFDAWIRKDSVELARKYPRRSCEVWASRYEADPISFLGATTPARDLGLLKLSRDGSYTYYPPGDTVMADETKTEKPAADPKESGTAKEKCGKDDQILTILQQIVELLQGGGQGQEAPAAAGASSDQQMSDAEYQQLLQELTQEQEPRKPDAPAEAPVKNERAEAVEKELQTLRSQVSSMQVKDALVKLQRDGKDVNPDDEALIADLAAMPDDMRNRTLDRMAKFSRSTPAASFHLDTALASAVPSGTKGRRIQSADEQKALIKLARERGVDFGTVLKTEGYEA